MAEDTPLPEGFYRCGVCGREYPQGDERGCPHTLRIGPTKEERAQVESLTNAMLRWNRQHEDQVLALIDDELAGKRDQELYRRVRASVADLIENKIASPRRCNNAEVRELLLLAFKAGVRYQAERSGMA